MNAQFEWSPFEINACELEHVRVLKVIYLLPASHFRSRGRIRWLIARNRKPCKKLYPAPYQLTSAIMKVPNLIMKCFGSPNSTGSRKLSRLPSAWRLGFLANKFLGFLRFLAKIWEINLGKVRKNLQDFSRLWKEIQENFWISWQENQE